MANLKTKKTAAGAQQYSSKGAAAKLNKAVDKDIQAYLDDKMIRAEFWFKVSHSFDGLKVNHKSVFTIRASTKNSTIKGYSGFNISNWYG